MSAERDVTRIVRSWLHEDAHEDADRVLGLVLDELDTTPQRRASWPAWRSPSMSNTVRITLAAVAVVVVAIVGIKLFGGTGVGGPGASPSPSEAASLAPTPTATPVPTGFLPAGAQTIGRHSMVLSGARVSIDIPADGWTSNGAWGLQKGTWPSAGNAGFIFWPLSAPDNVFSDPCSQTLANPPPGGSAAELATAVATIPGVTLVSGPSEVRVGGHPAQYVVLTFTNDIGCAPDHFYLWEDYDTPDAARYATEVGETLSVWIIDVNGTIVWIDGETFLNSGPEAEQELQDIVNSIQFE